MGYLIIELVFNRSLSHRLCHGLLDHQTDLYQELIPQTVSWATWPSNWSSTGAYHIDCVMGYLIIELLFNRSLSHRLCHGLLDHQTDLQQELITQTVSWATWSSNWSSTGTYHIDCVMGYLIIELIFNRSLSHRLCHGLLDHQTDLQQELITQTVSWATWSSNWSSTGTYHTDCIMGYLII